MCSTDLRCTLPTFAVHYGAQEGPMSMFLINSDCDGAQYNVVCLSAQWGPMSVRSGGHPRHFSFLSPPVQFAQWAHMHRFLSVRLSVCPSGLDQKSD